MEKHKQTVCVGHRKVKHQWNDTEEIIIWFDIEILYSVIALALSDVENEISYFWPNSNKKITVFWGDDYLLSEGI